VTSKKPRGWKAKSRPAYEDGGEAIGRIMLWNPEREPKIWALIAGTKLWPRWYLSAFRTHYVKDHPTEYSLWKNRKWRKKHQKARTESNLRSQRDRAIQSLQ
jgi:hypothetical protein